MSDRIAVGIIRRAHGVRGEASVEPWTDSVDRFDELTNVTLVAPDETKTRDARIESVRFHAGRALVKFAGVDAPEDVQQLRNWSVEIAASDARVLEAGEYFLHDLVGLTLVDANGVERGVVIDAYEGGGGVLLNVKRADGRKYEIPFAEEICTQIDPGAKKMIVNLPAGLDDLDSVSE